MKKSYIGLKPLLIHSIVYASGYTQAALAISAKTTNSSSKPQDPDMLWN